MSVKSSASNKLVCAATLAHSDYARLCYIDETKALSNVHFQLYCCLRNFVDQVLSGKRSWKLSKISSKLVQIIDHNNKHADDELATPDMLEYLARYATPQILIACLTGSNYQLSTAQQCILDIVQWRVCSRIDEALHPKQFANAIQSASVFHMNEFDRHGHPICHLKVLAETPEDPWVVVRAAVFCIEKCVRACKQYQILWLIDCQNLGYSTMPPIEILREVSNLMTYYYPERLYKAYLLYTPWLFDAIFGMTAPCLPNRTQSKLVNVGWYASNNASSFDKDIHKTALRKRYGGEVEDTPYSYEWECKQGMSWNVTKEDKSDLHVEQENKDEEHEADDDDDDDDDDKLCIVCLDGVRDHVLIPCGHLCVCQACKGSYEKEQVCPLCRTPVQMVVKTFT